MLPKNGHLVKKNYFLYSFIKIYDVNYYLKHRKNIFCNFTIFELVNEIGGFESLWKGASVGHFGSGEDPTIRIMKFFCVWNRTFEGVEASEVAEADEVNDAAEVLRPEIHYWGLQSHPGSYIQLYFDVL